MQFFIIFLTTLSVLGEEINGKKIYFKNKFNFARDLKCDKVKSRFVKFLKVLKN